MFILYATLSMLFYIYVPYYNKLYVDNKTGSLPVLRRAYVGIVLIQVSSILLFSLEILSKVIQNGNTVIYLVTTVTFIFVSFVLNIIVATIIEQRYLQSTQLVGFFIADMDKELISIVIMVTAIQAANICLYKYINFIN